MKSRWFAGLLVVMVAAGVGYGLPVTDGLFVHLRAEDLELADGEQVTYWPDVATADVMDGSVEQDWEESWHGASDLAAPPTYKLSGENGWPAVQFDGNLKQALRSQQIRDFRDYEGLTYFVRARAGTEASMRVCSVGSFRGYGNRYVAAQVSSGGPGWGLGSGMEFAPDNWALTGMNANVLVSGEWFTGGYKKRWRPALVDDPDTVYAVGEATPVTVDLSIPTASPYAVQVNSVQVGNGLHASSWAGNSWYTGEVSEIIVYMRCLSAAEMELVMSYLNAKYERKAASDPLPADGAVEVGVLSAGMVEVTFEWDAWLDGSTGEPNATLTEHRLYYGLEPGLAGVSPVVLPVGTPAEARVSYGPVALETDSVYYWRVDEVSHPEGEDPNVYVGEAWSFETIKTLAIIEEQPGQMLVSVGESAGFSIVASSLTAASYEWIHSLDNATDTPGDDAVVGGDSASLELTDVQYADEGYYFCKVTNKAGSVYSEGGRLGVRRLVAHWPLDLSGYVGGQYQDVVGGHHADPWLAPDPNSFVPGVNAVTSEALDIAGTEAAAQAGTWEPSALSEEMTISLWANVVNGTRQGIVTKRDVGETMSWIWQIFPGGYMDFRAPGLSEGLYPNTQLAGLDGQWLHLVVTASEAGTALYVNGEQVATSIGWIPPGGGSHIGIGTNTIDAGVPGAIFAGMLDDVRIYNYAMSHEEVLDINYGILGQGFCLDPPAAFDVTGGGVDGTEADCKVDLADFAVLMGQWLECGLYPVEYCD